MVRPSKVTSKSDIIILIIIKYIFNDVSLGTAFKSLFSCPHTTTTTESRASLLLSNHIKQELQPTQREEVTSTQHSGILGRVSHRDLRRFHSIEDVLTFHMNYW